MNLGHHRKFIFIVEKVWQPLYLPVTEKYLLNILFVIVLPFYHLEADDASLKETWDIDFMKKVNDLSNITLITDILFNPFSIPT